MGQKIKVQIAGEPRPLIASSPQQEELIRKGAALVNKVFGDFQKIYQNKSTEDKLVFTALHLAMTYIETQKAQNAVSVQAKALDQELENYLANIGK